MSELIYKNGKIHEVIMDDKSLTLPIPEFMDQVDYLIGRSGAKYPLPVKPHEAFTASSWEDETLFWVELNLWIWAMED